MNIAWFRATYPGTSALLDEAAPVIAILRRRHQLDVLTAAEAHDFVWRHFRQPYDVCVYEPGATTAHRFIDAYLAHYPGIIAPSGLGIAALPHSWSQADGPAVRTTRNFQLGLLTPSPLGVVTRAIERAQAAGVAARLVPGFEPAVVLRDADLIVALDWPPGRGAPTAALLGMAARKPVVVLEVEATAAWPVLDPQTWQPRGWSPAAPVAVSLDPRDEEHSLLLTIRRLAADAALCDALATAAFTWWRDHATLDHAVRAWEQLLADAARNVAASSAPADHSGGVRKTLDEFGVRVDFL